MSEIHATPITKQTNEIRRNRNRIRTKMTTTTTTIRTPRTRTTTATNRYIHIKIMIYCYFLATTASTTSMRRMIGGSSAVRGGSQVVEAFIASPKNTINRGAHRHTQRYSFSALSSSSSASPIKTEQQQKIEIPRPQKVENTPTATVTAPVPALTTVDNPPPLLNLHTITLEEISELVVSWGYPKFRGKQIYGWIRDKGVTNPNDMQNLPKELRDTIVQFTSRPSSSNNSDNDTLEFVDNDAGVEHSRWPLKPFPKTAPASVLMS